MTHDAVRAPSAIHRWWAVPLAALGLLTITTVLVMAVVPSTVWVDKQDCVERDEVGECVALGPVEEVQFAIVPASAQSVSPRLDIAGVEQFPSDGDFYFVTIRSPELTTLDWFVARNNPATSLRSFQDLFGDSTPAQQTEQGFQMMRTAKDVAEFVAFTRLGLPIEVIEGDVIIEQMVCLAANDEGTVCEQFAPSDEVLDPGDKLLKADGVALTTVDDLGGVLADKQPGDTVEIEFERDGTVQTGTVELIAAPGEDPPRTIVGFVPIDTTTIELPDGVNINIQTNSIGGPSAGLAFTLTLIDELSPGDLTGGERIAVTGTINIDGSVGPIGGLASKASAVAQVGVKYFLVPASQRDIEAAQIAAGDGVTLIPVATLDEALEVLEELGGDSLAVGAAGG